MLLYSILNATEAVYRCLLFLRGKNGERVHNRGQFSIFCTQSRYLSQKQADFTISFENNGKIGLFWFSILPLFSENNGKIRDFFLAKLYHKPTTHEKMTEIFRVLF